ncbi:MAG: chorismate synthase [Rhodobacteraceae bacterium]|nr:chorismate synthase [Paracoccaceae bacterium]
MSTNSFGRLFSFTTWGESHGPAIGVTVDGCPPELPLDEAWLQHWLDRRRPGQNRFTTQRREPDSVEILSGVFEGSTTGAPIQLMIRNLDQRSKDYSDIKDRFRPGHADITYWRKYGIRDYRGGGRASARETASRVAVGGIARRVLESMAPGLRIQAYLIQIGALEIDRSRFNSGEIDGNPFWCPDAGAVEGWGEFLTQTRKSGDSIGAVVECIAEGVPAGLGAPVYAKLDADLAAAMMSINAVKAVEIGAGMSAATLTGSENADEIEFRQDNPRFLSNNSGGILGGISTGQDIILRFAVKPASSILNPRATITKSGEAVAVVTKGRHDPCVGIRAVPVAEAMMACVLADHLMLHRGQVGTNRGNIG